jgi:hypothetical protein
MMEGAMGLPNSAKTAKRVKVAPIELNLADGHGGNTIITVATVQWVNDAAFLCHEANTECEIAETRWTGRPNPRGIEMICCGIWNESRGTHWLVIWKGFQAWVRPAKVKMRTPTPTFHAFLVKFAETLVSNPRNNQSEAEHPFQRMADHPPVEHEDENASEAEPIEAKMNPSPQFFTHHFKRCQILWNFEVDARWQMLTEEKMTLSSPFKSHGCVHWQWCCDESTCKTMQFERGFAWRVGLTTIDFLEKQDLESPKISSDSWQISTEQTNMSFMTPAQRFSHRRMMVSDAQSENRTMRSEVIDAAF